MRSLECRPIHAQMLAGVLRHINYFLQKLEIYTNTKANGVSDTHISGPITLMTLTNRGEPQRVSGIYCQFPKVNGRDSRP